MNEKIKYSIIIPHHNIPQLLDRSLKSIPEIPEIQVVVVDDNSDLNKIDAIKKVCARSNVELILTKEGKGAGYARNVGISKAKGRWLLFCDSDDFFADGFLNKLDEYYDSNYDLIFFNFQTIDSDTLEELPKRVFIHDVAMKKKNIEYLRYGFPPPWAKLVKKTVVDNNKIKFEEVPSSNDVHFSGMIGLWSDKAKIDDYVLYIAAVRKNSLTKLESVTSLGVRINVARRYNDFLKSINKNKYGCRTNILHYIWNMRKVDKAAFKNNLKIYFATESLRDIWIDLLRSLAGLCTLLFNPETKKCKNVYMEKNRP